MGRKRKTGAPKIRGLELEAQALELRKFGASYRAIASRLGCSKAGAYKAVIRALEKLAKERDGRAQELRELELQRLDMATLSIARQVQSGDYAAIDRWLKVVRERARLLGLYAPEKVEGKTEVGFTEDALQALRSRLVPRSSPGGKE